MAVATLHKLPETEPIDPRACVLQAAGLLSALLRHLGGEVSQQDRASDADTFHAIEAALHFLENSLSARPEDVKASAGASTLKDSARGTLQRACGALRVIRGAAFITAADSVSGATEQAMSDTTLVNALWAVSELVDKAKKETL